MLADQHIGMITLSWAQSILLIQLSFSIFSSSSCATGTAEVRLSWSQSYLSGKLVPPGGGWAGGPAAGGGRAAGGVGGGGGRLEGGEAGGGGPGYASSIS